ncbi:transcriptional regulator, partial [Enterococcus casseliflavus]
MRLFDVHQFELPEKEVIDWDKTKREIGSMFSSYLVSRERMGLTRMSPIHSTYSLLDQDIPEIKHSSFVQEN